MAGLLAPDFGRGAAAPANRVFSEKGGWADLIEPHKGLKVDRLPAEWIGRLQCIADPDGYITLDTMAAVAVREYAATTVVKGKISIRGFPEHLHETLKAFDPDDSGNIGAQELQHAAVLYSESKKTQMRMVRLLVTLFVTMLVVCCVVAGLTYAVVEGTKEVRTGTATPEGQVLMTVGHGDNKGAPVSTMTPLVDLPLGAIAYIPELHGVHGMLDRVMLGYLMRKDGAHGEYMTTITGISVGGTGANLSMTMYTVAGGTIHLSSLAHGVLTHRDGTKDYFCGLCATCGAMNAARTPGITRGLEAFQHAVKVSHASCVPHENAARAARRAARRGTTLHDWGIFDGALGDAKHPRKGGHSNTVHNHEQPTVYDSAVMHYHCSGTCSASCSITMPTYDSMTIFDYCNHNKLWGCRLSDATHKYLEEVSACRTCGNCVESCIDTNSVATVDAYEVTQDRKTRPPEYEKPSMYN